jgi:hypothetical protein
MESIITKEQQDAMAYLAAQSARSITLTLNDIIGGSYAGVKVTFTEQAKDGALVVRIESPNGDLRGFGLDWLYETGLSRG